MRNDFLEVAIEAATEAGHVLRAALDHPVKANRKGPLDLVTEADRRSEQAIVGLLRARFPKHSILSEEEGEQKAETECRWIVDPLDGTTNFVHGYPQFAVSIAFEQRGDLMVGVVHHPITKDVFSAARGEGAYLNATRIRVSGIGSLSAGLVATNFPSLRRTPKPNMDCFRNVLLRSQGVRRDGSAALDLASVACGRLDGFWDLGLHVWDTAAGVLLVREAGGMVTNFAGQPYHLGDYEILGSNARVHEEMLRALVTCDQ